MYADNKIPRAKRHFVNRKQDTDRLEIFRAPRRTYRWLPRNERVTHLTGGYNAAAIQIRLCLEAAKSYRQCHFHYVCVTTFSDPIVLLSFLHTELTHVYAKNNAINCKILTCPLAIMVPTFCENDSAKKTRPRT